MKEELIKHITEQLKQYETPYAEGAWERFSEKKKKRRVAYWPIWSAVAVLLISAGLYFNYNPTKTVIQESTVQNKSQKQVDNNNITAPNITETDIEKGQEKANHLSENHISTDQKTVFNYPSATLKDHKIDQKTAFNPAPTAQSTAVDTLKNSTTPKSDVNTVIEKNTIILAENNNLPKAPQITEPKKVLEKQSFEELLAKDALKEKKNPLAKSNKSKWQPEFYVAPSMGNDEKMNLNYGFSISYAVADKISIGTGLAYNNLSSTTNKITSFSDQQSSPATYRLPVESSKSLESVQAQLRGVTIPLDLKYNISDKFYTSVGVSALALINNNQKNNYLVNSVENQQSNNVFGVAVQKTMIVQQTVTETTINDNLTTDKYIGFYNFSIGYKQKISKKNNIAFEPFLAVPMKSFSKESLNLTNGGFKLKVNF